MPDFTFEQEVFSLIKRTSEDLKYTLDCLAGPAKWAEAIENKLFRFLIEENKLRAKFKLATTIPKS